MTMCARKRCTAKLAELNKQQVLFSNAPRHGDRFPYFLNYVERDPQIVASHFGLPMAEEVFALTTRSACRIAGARLSGWRCGGS